MLIVQDSLRGRFQVKNTNLSEWFHPGDVIFMDPSQIHWVNSCAREEDRKFLVKAK